MYLYTFCYGLFQSSWMCIPVLSYTEPLRAVRQRIFPFLGACCTGKNLEEHFWSQHLSALPHPLCSNRFSSVCFLSDTYSSTAAWTYLHQRGKMKKMLLVERPCICYGSFWGDGNVIFLSGSAACSLLPLSSASLRFLKEVYAYLNNKGPVFGKEVSHSNTHYKNNDS